VIFRAGPLLEIPMPGLVPGIFFPLILGRRRGGRL